jgi:uncharacterized protein (DUF983 family)
MNNQAVRTVSATHRVCLSEVSVQCTRCKEYNLFRVFLDHRVSYQECVCCGQDVAIRPFAKGCYAA